MADDEVVVIDKEVLKEMTVILISIQNTAFDVFQKQIPRVMGMPKIQSECEKLKVILADYLT